MRKDEGVPERVEETSNSGVELVLEHLRRIRAFDFTGYKRTTLARRIRRRMQQLGIETQDDYVDYLEVHPEEFEPLFNTILINVTSFFRDPDAWTALRERVVPELVEHRRDGPIRVWSAGCATGEEAYSAVMLFAEALGPANIGDRLKVYATDVDAEALERARRAVFTAKDVEAIPAELRDRYFDEGPRGLVFADELRRMVIFGRHDLLQDAPISRVDLLLCRNTLMYFNADVQAQLVERLHFSVADDGFLMLGKVESLLGHGELFRPVDGRQRIFRKVRRRTMRARLLSIGGLGSTPAFYEPAEEGVLDVAFEHRRHGELLLDDAGNLIGANAQARALFGVPLDAVGRPFQDLELSYRPVELRTTIDRARADGHPLSLHRVERWTPSGGIVYIDIDIVPLQADGQQLGVLLSFIDVTHHHELQEELEQTHRELETTNEELQSSNEELETTNEELQSTIEELETTNEELQSTNEELETMNEELSSSNEELQAMNDELRDRTGELNQVNAYMESILTSLQASVIVVDRDLRVRVWNGLSFELWGLRPDEVEGRGFMGLDIGFPVEQLGRGLRRTLASGPVDEVRSIPAVTRRGHAVSCRARVSPLRGADGVIEGAIVLIEAEAPNGQSPDQ